ncbi:AT-rich interactive domain-containing protein 1-like [Cucurbita maxima]|uniref:AT-rich interactive domain-containing protein 1-like n=1 Tax=Cucurbita maxima TaxID=3661 RepID=A0A6J1L5C2_CUCMA|nr:AT-rich interactive domain-containing protein 1-like [Cucurbita maxima]XP_023006589.1 AT-rich interactive domain-containing protein 1-like [Cucurbita maxima]
MLSDEFMNYVAFDENSISDFSKRILAMKSDKMKSGDVFPRRSKKLKDINHCNNENEDIKIIDLRLVKEPNFTPERKEEPLLGLLNWLKGIARNPCDPSVCSLPEKSKWKSYGNEEIWKQVLLVREKMFVKRQVDSSSEQSLVQRNQRMHPCMYDNDTVPIYNLRKRLSFEKKDLSQEPVSKTSDSSPTDSSDDYKPVPLGSDYQTQVPEWNGVISESDLKWLGTQDWPLKKVRNRYLVERDPIGRGRRDPCGCFDANSVGCVKFHVTEKRHKVKLELGDAFLQWRFDKMGEDVTFSWTADDEKKFEDIVTSNPPSLGISFWDEIIESFPSRSKADLVCYYYNVFLLRRRGHQNRVTPNEIDSDEESESGIVTNGLLNQVHNSSDSIFYSPKKPRCSL